MVAATLSVCFSKKRDGEGRLRGDLYGEWRGMGCRFLPGVLETLRKGEMQWMGRRKKTRYQ